MAPPAPSLTEGRDPASFLLRLREDVRPDLERHRIVGEASTQHLLSAAADVPVAFKPPLVVRTLRDPWEGLIALEHQGSGLATRVDRWDEGVARVLGRLATRRSGGAMQGPRPAFPTGAGLHEHLDVIEAVLRQAGRLREEALAALSPAEREFLFEHAGRLVPEFSPHHSEMDAAHAARAEADWRWGRLYEERVDGAKLLAAAALLARFGNEAWLHAVARATAALPGPHAAQEGVTGQVVAARRTPAGRIVIGGPGDNTYDMTGDVAVILDVGGADTYRGAIAAAGSPGRGVNVVVDLGGDDRYHAAPLGLATGRLGVGMLIDGAGDDVYHLAEGSGGTGFGGIGVLLDVAGHDRYLGTRLTQGAAMAGIGLLLDGSGDDEFTSFGYAIGFGGPLGVGAVIDAAGDDRYVCGGTYPSAYNATDAPEADPDDPAYQYDGFCLGAGVGKRILGREGPSRHQLAGGVGWLVDAAGNDRYASANFSQGAGYFFGAGVKLDLAGNDRHEGARYGHGAAAHQGVGLFIDANGGDVYASSGPVFNGGTAWDRSVAALVDAGAGDDVYEFSRSDGLGRAAHASWSLVIEEAGNERYALRRGLGRADAESVSRFFDLGGDDDYVDAGAFELGPRGNRRTVNDGGGLFVDR